jgi:hypothetical protein
MMNTYFLLDNNPTDQSNSIVRKINMSDKIKVIPMEMLPWEQQVSGLLSQIGHIDGILLDWRLFEPDEKSKISYSAEALAQHFRFLFNDGQLTKDVPIILCSANRDFRNFYERDASGHDLFVAVYSKMDFAEKAEEVAKELVSFAEGFKAVQQQIKPTPQSLLLTPATIHLDSRLEGDLLGFIGYKTSDKLIPHNLIRFLFEEVVQRPGILLNEDLLAARLGLDKGQSADWASLLAEHLSPAFGYAGILSDGWQRWWADGLIDWWKSEISPKHPQYFGAAERVRLLSERTSKNGFVAAQKLPFCVSDEFWTICEATRSPIDPADGLRIQSENTRAWQEEQYISLHSILERKNTFKLNPIEKERFDYLKNLATKNGKN